MLRIWVPFAGASVPVTSTLVPSPALCARPLVLTLCLVQGVFKPYWPPALLQQAPPAIILAALRRFRGPALFRGLRLSSSQCVPSWLSGLTRQSSGPAKGGPLTLVVSRQLHAPRRDHNRHQRTTLVRCHAAMARLVLVLEGGSPTFLDGSPPTTD